MKNCLALILSRITKHVKYSKNIYRYSYCGRSGRGIDWFDLAQDKDRWLALVNAVMNLRVLFDYLTGPSGRAV